MIDMLSFILFPGTTAMARYFLSRARRVCARTGTEIPVTMKWLCHPLGHRFFVDGHWTMAAKRTIFSSSGNDADPLGHVTQAFREHLVERALYPFVTPSQDYEESDRNG